MDNNEMILNGSTATWIMPKVDGELGGTYTGKFVFRCYLSPLQTLQAGREYRALLGELAAQASDDEGRLAFCLTQLKYRIISAPPFWTSTMQDSGIAGNIGDLNVIGLVLDKAIEAQIAFKEKIAKEREAVLENAIKVAEEIQMKNSDPGQEA